MLENADQVVLAQDFFGSPAGEPDRGKDNYPDAADLALEVQSLTEDE